MINFFQPPSLPAVASAKGDQGSREAPILQTSVLELPGYWQKQVADDLIFGRGLLQVNWDPGQMQNRCGFAFSPHFPHPHELTPAMRFWTAEKNAESMKYAG